jgi:NADH:ubiquinone oxidoreductase subunit
VQDGERKCVTVLEGVSAAGVFLPPLINDKRAAHWMGWHAYVTENEPAYFPYSPKGWTNNELGVEYRVKVFEPQAAAV